MDVRQGQENSEKKGEDSVSWDLSKSHKDKNRIYLPGVDNGIIPEVVEASYMMYFAVNQSSTLLAMWSPRVGTNWFQLRSYFFHSVTEKNLRSDRGRKNIHKWRLNVNVIKTTEFWTHQNPTSSRLARLYLYERRCAANFCDSATPTPWQPTHRRWRHQSGAASGSGSWDRDPVTTEP